MAQGVLQSDEWMRKRTNIKLTGVPHLDPVPTVIGSHECLKIIPATVVGWSLVDPLWKSFKNSHWDVSVWMREGSMAGLSLEGKVIPDKERQTAYTCTTVSCKIYMYMHIHVDVHTCS